jgi:hypothetical protein
MAIESDELAQITARAGVLRAGTGRAGAVEEANRLKSSGQFIWNRDEPNLGNPDDTAAGWVSTRS